LRQCQLVVARRQGTWMHYRINPELPAWAQQTLANLVSPACEALSLNLPVPACCEN
jgi:ArsR family transcriptional regulator